MSRVVQRCAWTWGLFGLWLVRAAVSLELPHLATNGWIQLTSPGASNQVHVLESSPDLVTWHEAAVLHDGPFDFADVTAPTNGTRFLRLQSRPRTAQDDGKNQIRLSDDAFAEPAVPADFFQPGKLGWVKFAILRGDETRVWFQDSPKYPFHFNYARLRLAPFAGMTAPQFDQSTLYRSNQLAVLGAVLLPPAGAGNEFGIQFVGQDAWTREEVARWFELVRAGVLAPPGARVFYVPTFEQAAVANSEREWLAARGVVVADATRWLTTDAVYSEGWAVGRLVFVPGGEIAAAYADGRLRPDDILLTDGVPAEVPFVAGLITLAPATPNSHVAILARGYGVPFVWFADAALQQNLRDLAGREVALRTGLYGAAPKVVEVTGQLTSELRAQLAALKLPSPLKYTPKAHLGVLATNVTTLTPAATRFVGGKAANYGLLRRTIPANSSPALALTFDVWDAFLDQTLPGGNTLRSELALRLGGFTYPPDITTVRDRLAAVRDLFTKTASFPPALRAAVLEALQNGPFEPGRKLRFRSSTNVEDSEDFTGAGLYDSYSGCLADDLDGDASGPSACDPDEVNERGVFRAIQRVYASFYNENAFLERLRRGVKEDEVGMAVLVHHSYPDADELANGVATLNASRSFGELGSYGELVTQLGAVSVTNPDSTARPELVTCYQSGGSIGVTWKEGSSLVPLGGYVMKWETDYRELVRLLGLVTKGYSAMFPAKTEFALDFEYKRMTPGRLEVKQVRPLPRADGAGTVTSFLLGEPAEWCVLEGEFGAPLAKHRLKGQFATMNGARRLDATGLSTTFYRDATFTFRDGTNWISLTNGPANWPGFTHAVQGDDVFDRWTVGEGAARREFELKTTVTRSVPAGAPAWFTPTDFFLTLEAKYAQPQPELGWDGTSQTLSDSVVLQPCPAVMASSLRQERTLNSAGGLELHTQFWWPAPPSGPSAGYTAPNIGFIESRVSRLTKEPLVLRAAAAQTYSPGHHNFTETFVLEPRLDPAVPAEQLAELEALNIRLLLVTQGFEGAGWWAVDAAGKMRELK